MPATIQPMLATLVDEPFNDPDWLFEVKLDGYRAVAFIEKGRARYVSRNQNEFTADFPELADLPARVRGKQVILDGEICVLDDEGRPSFSLMQQRTSYEPGRVSRRSQLGGRPIVYYVFDVLYLDGYSLMRVDLEQRKELLRRLLKANETFRYSEHFLEEGLPLYEVARQKTLEGIIAKRRKGCYLQKRTREWLKIKITQMQECVIGGYTEPRGSREHFGSLVLGLYDDAGKLIPVGQAGTGFNRKSEAEMAARLRKLETEQSPFAYKPDSSREIHFVKPQLVAQIKFTEWTHEGARKGAKSGGLKMRAPVFMGLRVDKKP
ncbi:MAG TPA: non-homologous end-joining DNA ligase, partial [Terriglobales bacterium]|nr:non-homologous end-joining DNA ligase [Terriglobales bacterium]